MSTRRATNLVMPDAVAATITWLKAHALLPTVDRIQVDMNGWTQAETLLTVANPAGGFRSSSGYLSMTRIDLNSFAPTKKQAHDIIRAAVAASLDMAGYRASDGVVARVEVGLEPSQQTDWLNENPRYVAEVDVFMRPLRAGE